MIHVKSFYAHNELRNYSYLVINDVTRDCWAIDPYDGAALSQYIKDSGLRPVGILNTHQHHDHTRGNAQLVGEFHCAILTPKDSEEISLGSGAVLRVANAPGHTMDHQIYLLIEDGKVKALFAGDTLFYSGVGNCKNGGSVDSLYHTVGKLLNLVPGEATLYPGHDYEEKNLRFALSQEPDNEIVKSRLQEIQGRSTNLEFHDLDFERKMNPFFRHGLENLESFKHLRSLRDHY